MIKRKLTSTDFRKYVVIAASILILSSVISVPVSMLTYDWSARTALAIYAGLTRIVSTHSPAIVTIDEKGIPEVDYGYQKGKYTGIQRNPLTIATRAIAYYDEFQMKNNEKTRQYFLNCIDWLIEAKVDKTDFVLWYYEFDLPSYSVKAPWYSAMAQARIMVAFQRAYEMTENKQYLDMANKALRSLATTIENGGVLAVDPQDGGKWFEEVVGVNMEHSPLVLNGNIFALFDLHDFYLRTASVEAKSLFDEGVIELKRHLKEYDTGRWTYYDRVGHLAYDYHYVHIDQLQKLFKITGDSAFREYYDKWKAYFPINPMWARKRFAGYLLDNLLIYIFLLFVFIVYRTIIKYRCKKQTQPGIVK